MPAHVMKALIRGTGVLLVSSMLAATAFASELTGRQEILGRLVPVTGEEELRAVDLDVRFELGSARLTTVAREQLDEVGHALAAPELAGMIMGIYGHTDSSGPAEYNKQLSQERADAVRAYLIENFKLDGARLVAIGYGEERLKNTETPTAAENRRVQIVNLSPPPARPAETDTAIPVQPSPEAVSPPAGIPEIPQQPAAPSGMPALQPPAAPGSAGGMQPIN